MRKLRNSTADSSTPLRSAQNDNYKEDSSPDLSPLTRTKLEGITQGCVCTGGELSRRFHSQLRQEQPQILRCVENDKPLSAVTL